MRFDDEGGEVLGVDRRLAQLLGEGADGAVGLLVGGDAADQLDQLHPRHRVHEVHAAELAGPVGLRRQPGDGDRRRVGGDERLRREHRAQLPQDLLLHRLVLDRALDHQIAVLEAVIAETRADPRQRRLLVAPGDLPPLDLTIHVLRDGRPRRLQPILVHVGDVDVEPGEHANVGDATAHLAGADDADLPDLLRHGCPLSADYLAVDALPAAAISHLQNRFARRACQRCPGRPGDARRRAPGALSGGRPASTARPTGRRR